MNVIPKGPKGEEKKIVIKVCPPSHTRKQVQRRNSNGDQWSEKQSSYNYNIIYVVKYNIINYRLINIIS